MSARANRSAGFRFRPRLESFEDRCVPAVYTVTNTDPTGPGSLTQAITDANARVGADSIQFQIPGAGVRTINLTAGLPLIIDPVAIDGTTESGYAGKPLVELSGGYGINISTSNCSVTGLVINTSAGYGISMSGPGKNVIQGNYIGTDATGTLRKGNLAGGIYIAVGSNGNIIGTNGDGVNDAAEGNLISANGFFNRRVPTGGVYIDGAHKNVISGNLIGTDVTGTTLLYNAAFGVSIVNGGQQNIVGTNGNGVSDALERNVITGYAASVYLSDYGTNNNVVAGNFIGTDVSGSKSLSAGGAGVRLAIGADRNRIGTDANGRSDALERNVISGCLADAGVDVQSDFNTVAGNYIGTDATGTLALGNYIGVQVTGWTNTIGGARAAARNVISGNATDGIFLQCDSPKVQGNIIGLDATGTRALGNNTGISVSSSSNVTIGGATAAARNVISGNVNDGIDLMYLYGPATIQGNYIGTDATGLLAIGNGTLGDYPSGYGINVYASDGVTIGGSTAGTRNVISGNVLGGIAVEAWSSGTTITGNYIGTDRTGKVALGNQGAGVLLTGLVGNTTVGGTTAGLRNVISGNQVGIHVADGSSGTVIQGNYIGTDSTGKLALGNTAQGVLISGGATGTVVGAPATPVAIPAGVGNVIAFNGAAGVAVIDPTSVNNTIRGNSIFGNLGLGIDLGNDGVTANAPGGSAPGPNNFLGYPLLSRVVFGASTRVIGTYTGGPNSTFTIDLYASPTADPTGYGQGKRYLGSVVVTTDATGLATFDVTLAVATKAGEMISATATDAAGSTSEFSPAVKAAK